MSAEKYGMDQIRTGSYGNGIHYTAAKFFMAENGHHKNCPSEVMENFAVTLEQSIGKKDDNLLYTNRNERT